jgi:long-subunit acyl-CoA synthetase (AMP-forming)
VKGSSSISDAPACDLRRILSRLANNHQNQVVWLEAGRVVTRTFSQMAADVERACDRLRRSGVTPGARVGLLAPNCYLWLVNDLALQEIGAVRVAFVEEMATRASEELVSTWDLALLLRNAPPGEPPLTCRLDLAGDAPGIARQLSNPLPDDPPLSLIFSSGSEGRLKCMEVDRLGVQDMVTEIGRSFPPVADDRVLLFLPLSNFQQQVLAYAALWLGVDVAIVAPADLFRGLARLKPTIIIGPPLFFETIENQVHALRGLRRLFAIVAGHACSWVPVRRWRRWLQCRVFARVHQGLGGRMRRMITGMAPISPRTLKQFARMGFDLYEAYGLAECGFVAWNTPAANRVGAVGRPVIGTEVELAPDGEVIVRKRHLPTRGYVGTDIGRNIYLGDGRLATGDIGRLDRAGFLYLVGRKKEIIVTPSGEKVHPERIEVRVGEVAGVSRCVAWSARMAADGRSVPGIDLLVSTTIAPAIASSTGPADRRPAQRRKRAPHAESEGGPQACHRTLRRRGREPRHRAVKAATGPRCSVRASLG